MRLLQLGLGDVKLVQDKPDTHDGFVAAKTEDIPTPLRQRVVERWSWKHCAQLTVDQYREVLAMPQNVAKLRANGRI